MGQLRRDEFGKNVCEIKINKKEYFENVKGEKMESGGSFEVIKNRTNAKCAKV